VRSYVPVSADPASNSVATGHLGPGPELLELQELDLSIDRLTARIDALESQEDIRAARERATQLEAAVGEFKLSRDELAREQSRLETDLDSMERKIEAERKRMFDGSVANAKELQAIEAEIANLTHRRTDKEDRILELMEQREDLDSRLSPVEEELAQARGMETDVERTSAAELVEIRRTLEERTAHRAELAGRFDPEVLDLYEELRQSKKGVGVAALVDGVCQGCHQQLSPMYLDRLKRDDGVRRCEYCRRILVPA
jgi:predicted  nucleic acid-binding Zn-ribbon protein